MDRPSAAIAVHLRSVVSSSLLSDSRRKYQKEVSVHSCQGQMAIRRCSRKNIRRVSTQKKTPDQSDVMMEKKKVKRQGCVSSLQKPRDKKRTWTNRTTKKKKEKSKKNQNTHLFIHTQRRQFLIPKTQLRLQHIQRILGDDHDLRIHSFFPTTPGDRSSTALLLWSLPRRRRLPRSQ